MLEFISGRNQFHLNDVNPDRYRNQFSATLLGMLLESWYGLNDKVALINIEETDGAIHDFLGENDFKKNISCPLVVGERKVGLILAFGLVDTRTIRQTQISQILDILLGSVALILENSILIRDQEKTIRIRTNMLNNALRERSHQQCFLEAILNNIEDGIVACDSKGRLSLFNKATKKMHGLEQEDLPPEKWAEHYDLYKDDGKTPMQMADVPLFRAYNGELVNNVEIVIAPKNGKKRYCITSGQAMFDEKNNKLGAVVSMHDITELKQKEEALKNAKELAESANKAKSIFLANMSHELRTPLNAILGFSDMLGRDHELPLAVQKKVAIINRSGEHLLGMINDVLDLSKIEAGRVALEPEPFDLPQMLQDIGCMFEMRAEEVGLRFTLNVEQGIARFIKCDIGKLRQILINLLGNAVKFTREGGLSLRVRTLPMDSDAAMVTLQFEVQDSGPGIAPENLARIFEPFYQAGTSSTGPKGTGLGLTITKAFVELMGGEISLESTPGKGALFHIDLPVLLTESAEAGFKVAATPEVSGLEAGQPTWRVLVVEDNKDNRLLLSSHLLRTGFEVREAENGKDALCLFEKWQPHFIWMDMRMPVMDGYEATRKIRGLPGGDKVRIVAITASVFREQRQNILDAGCDDIVHKPFQAQELFSLLERYLGVKFIYSESDAQTAAQHPTEDIAPVSSEALALIPEALRKELEVALLTLEHEEIEKVIAKIAELDSVLGARLLRENQKFAYTAMLTVLRNSMKETRL